MLEKYLQNYFATEINFIRSLRPNKFIYQVNSKQYIVWQNNVDEHLLESIVNYPHTPTILNIKDVFIQEWYETDTKCLMHSLSAEMLANLHSIKIKKQTNSDWLSPICALWEQLSVDNQAMIGASAISWPKYKVTIPQPEQLSLCHGDLHPGNLIKYQDKFFLIDWELICLAPKEFDLAMVKQYQTKKEFSDFLKEYVNDYNLKLIDSYYSLCLYRCALWAFVQSNQIIQATKKVPEIGFYRDQLVNQTFPYSKTAFHDLGLSALKAFTESLDH